MGISLPVRGVDGGHALQLDAGLFLGHLGALKVGLAGGLLLIGLDFLQVLQLVVPLLQIGVLRGHHHIGGAVEGVGAGGVHSQLVPGGGVEIHLRAGGAADPVLLLGLHPLGVVHQSRSSMSRWAYSVIFSIHWLFTLWTTFAAAALAHAVDHFLVCQHALAGGTPVDVHLLFIGQPGLEQLEENPLVHL